MNRPETDETIIQRRTRRITITAVVVCAVILAGGSLIYVLLQNILNSTTDSRIMTASEEYRNNIIRLVESDIQILQTFGSFLGEEDVADEEAFSEKLYEANKKNDFLGMAYFGSGIGIMTAVRGGVETGVIFDTLPEELKEALERAGNGEIAVSDIYDSENMGEDMFAVCVPVIMKEKVMGVIAAADSASRVGGLFSEYFSSDAYSFVHLVGKDGVFRIRSREGSLSVDAESVFDNPYLDEETEESMKAAMQDGESGMYTLRVNGTRYKIYLEPVGINNWYLFCVNTMKEVVGSAYWVITGAQAAFIIILALCIFMIFFAFLFVRSNSRRLLRAAYTDPITGGCNLSGFLKKLDDACGHGTQFSVAALNMHQFKFINEIFGKEQADRLLDYIGTILRDELGKEEFFGRDTGDYFYLFLLETARNEVEMKLHKIMRKIKQAPFLERSSYHVLFYCGVTDTEGQERGGELPSRMMTQVMFALDKAGETRQDNVWFYDMQLHEKEKRENYIESHMHQALEKEEFRLFLQPKMNLQDGSLAGAEALVRWITDEGKMMFPGDFIPLFEKNGFCARLDMYMMECVCRHIHQWIEAGVQPIPISVNQSKLLFYEADYPNRLRELVAEYDIPAGLVTLEILEGLAIGNVEELNERIMLLQKEGFRVSMDDFGTGYSSLNVMGALKIDELKLDRAFLMEISHENNSRQRVVMEMVMALTRRLQIATVAEGVETEENEELIRELGCDMGQGYYYSRPISAEDFDRKFMKITPPASDR